MTARLLSDIISDISSEVIVSCRLNKRFDGGGFSAGLWPKAHYLGICAFLVESMAGLQDHIMRRIPLLIIVQDVFGSVFPDGPRVP